MKEVKKQAIRKELEKVGYQLEIETPVYKNGKWVGGHDYLVAITENPDIEKAIGFFQWLAMNWNNVIGNPKRLLRTHYINWRDRIVTR